MTHKRKDHTEKFCSKYWPWIITSRGDTTKQQLSNGFAYFFSSKSRQRSFKIVSSAFFRNGGKSSCDSSSRSFAEITVTRCQTVPSWGASITYAVIYWELSADLLGILNCFFSNSQLARNSRPFLTPNSQLASTFFPTRNSRCYSVNRIFRAQIPTKERELPVPIASSSS